MRGATGSVGAGEQGCHSRQTHPTPCRPHSRSGTFSASNTSLPINCQQPIGGEAPIHPFYALTNTFKHTHNTTSPHTPHTHPVPPALQLGRCPARHAIASDGEVLELSRSRFVRLTACSHWPLADRGLGTQIAPFLPISGTRSTFQSICGFLIFLLRLPFFLSIAGSYLLVVRWLPVGSLIRKAWLWSILGVCGVWWVDLQVEGVRRGCVDVPLLRFPLPPTDPLTDEKKNQIFGTTGSQATRPR